MDTLVLGFSILAQSIAVLAILQALITNGSLKYFFPLLHVSQLMAVFPLIDFPMPPNNKSLFSLLSLANGDFLSLKHLPNLFREKKLVDFDELTS